MLKQVFFSGATGGLGEVCVKALSATGQWQVFAAGTNDKKLSELQALPNVIPVHIDVTEDASVQDAKKLVSKNTKHLNAIVNFAGRSAMASMVEGDCIQTTQTLLNVNVMGMVRVNRIFFDLLLPNQSRIVNCSSESGWMTSQPFAAPYFLSKRAVESYSDSLRRELMFLNIPVIKIQPGSFQTNMTQSTLAGFTQTLHETKLFHDVLRKLNPLMTRELAHGNDPKKLAHIVLRALEARHPRLRYRVGTGKQLLMLELLPEKWVDLLYKTLVRLLPKKNPK